jgi:hypothetical protein
MKQLLSIVALLFLFSLCVHIGRAMADVAANAQIINQATLSFDDGSGAGIQTVNASVTVTVAHVPGIPTLNSPADASTAYTGVDTPLDFSYTITASGNGPDTYTLSSTVTAQTNTGGAGASVPASVYLGASITTGGSTATVLQVPSDGLSDAAVNGIAVGDTVVVNSELRTVSAVSDPAGGTATISLSAPLTAAPAIGVSVLEQQSFILTVTSGTIVASGSDIVVTAATTASSAAGATAADPVDATYTSGSATLTKYVRNVTNANGTTGATSFTVNGAASTYYTDGVTGVSGDVLEYLLLVDNTGAGNVTDCTIDDVLPTAFVTLVADAYGVNEIVYVDDAGVETSLSQEADADPAVVAGDNLSVNVGSGATAADGGTVGGSESVFIVYQVTIN